MNLIDHLKQNRLYLFQSIEPKEDVLDVVFIADLATNSFETFLLPYDGNYKKSEKLLISNQILDEIESKEFFNSIPSNINEVYCAIYFYSDAQNLVDYCHIYFFNQNICVYETYNFSGKTLLKGTRAIYRELQFNPDAELIKNLYANLDKINPSTKKDIHSRYLCRLKTDVKLFRDVINRQNITKLYHFTDIENIESIVDNNGLFSWVSCIRKHIEIFKPGGNNRSRSLDSYLGLEDYVRLSFNNQNPMMYNALKEGRISNPVVLEINPEVMLWENTLFSDMNANSNGANIGPNFQDLRKIDFSIAKNSKYLELPDNYKPYFQAEILVHSHIPSNYILNIHEFN